MGELIVLTFLLLIEKTITKKKIIAKLTLSIHVKRIYQLTILSILIGETKYKKKTKILAMNLKHFIVFSFNWLENLK